MNANIISAVLLLGIILASGTSILLRKGWYKTAKFTGAVSAVLLISTSCILFHAFWAIPVENVFKGIALGACLSGISMGLSVAWMAFKKSPT